jgi:hypothetical protein
MNSKMDMETIKDIDEDSGEYQLSGRKVAIDIVKANIFAVAMMPCVILGIIPSIVAMFIGNLPLLAWGIFFIAAAAGDIWMTWLLRKENPKSMVLDHPSEAGFYIID